MPPIKKPLTKAVTYSLKEPLGMHLCLLTQLPAADNFEVTFVIIIAYLTFKDRLQRMNLYQMKPFSLR